MFDTISIVGVGLIGGSIGLAVKQKRLARRVIGCARSEATRQAALKCGIIDQATEDPCDAVSEADLVVIATPVGEIVPIFQRILPFLKEPAIVTDVGSTKAEVVREIESSLRGCDKRVAFVGGHPMAGSERTGPTAARADLFNGATWALTPTEETNTNAAATLKTLVENLGAAPLIIDPETHDAVVAYTSHLPHLVAAALVNAVSDGSGNRSVTAQLTASGFRDTTRLAESSWRVWRDICATNRKNILEAIEKMQLQLEILRDVLRLDTEDKLIAWLQHAAATRPELMRDPHNATWETPS